jgi:hypothetical protein
LGASASAFCASSALPTCAKGHVPITAPKTRCGCCFCVPGWVLASALAVALALALALAFALALAVAVALGLPLPLPSPRASPKHESASIRRDTRSSRFPRLTLYTLTKKLGRHGTIGTRPRSTHHARTTPTPTHSKPSKTNNAAPSAKPCVPASATRIPPAATHAAVPGAPPSISRRQTGQIAKTRGAALPHGLNAPPLLRAREHLEEAGRLAGGGKNRRPKSGKNPFGSRKTTG